MIKKILSKIVLVTVLIITFLPVNLKAQDSGVIPPTPIFGGEGCFDENDNEILGPNGQSLTDVECGAAKAKLAIGSKSGITGTENIGDLLLKYVNFALPFLALAAFLGFVFAGFLYVTAYGAQDQIEKAKKILIYSVVGLIVVILSYSIVQLLTSQLVQSIQTQTQ